MPAIIVKSNPGMALAVPGFLCGGNVLSYGRLLHRYPFAFMARSRLEKNRSGT